jgi:hypothetical protein
VIVRCAQETRGLVAGREYVVLSVLVTPSAAHPLMFMLHRPDDLITDWAWYEAHAFEVLDETLPSNWIYSSHEDGFSLLPPTWARPGHWDDLLNDTDAASRRRAWDDYHAERDLILSESGRPPGDRGSVRVCTAPPIRGHS